MAHLPPEYMDLYATLPQLFKPGWVGGGIEHGMLDVVVAQVVP